MSCRPTERDEAESTPGNRDPDTSFLTRPSGSWSSHHRVISVPKFEKECPPGTRWAGNKCRQIYGLK